MEQTKSVETLQILSDFRAQLAHDNVDTEEYQPYFEKLQYLVNYIGCLERKNRALNEKNEKVEVLNDQIKELTNEKSRLKIKITVMTTERDCFHSTINSLEFERDEALRQTQIAKQEVCTSNEQLKKAKRDLRDEHNYYLCAKQELDELRKEIDQEVEGLHAKITELKDTVDTLQSRLFQKDEEISLTKARAVKAEKRVKEFEDQAAADEGRSMMRRDTIRIKILQSQVNELQSSKVTAKSFEKLKLELETALKKIQDLEEVREDQSRNKQEIEPKVTVPPRLQKSYYPEVSFMSDDVKAEESSPTQTSTPARTPKKRRMLLGCMPSPFYRKKKDRSTK
uniref:Uncharacterized protein n=1 Tax=Ditylenchus dipsaci TaxID=166011 RepID=A0A915CK55_9BILA